MTVGEVFPHRGRRHGAGAAARRHGVAGPALPDKNRDPLAVLHLGKLDIGAVGEHLVTLEERAEPREINLFKLRHEDHAVWVAYGDGRDREALPIDVKVLVDNFARRTGHRNLLTLKRRRAHVHGDPVHLTAVEVHGHLDDPARSLHRKLRLLHEIVVVEIPGQDPEPVPTLLGLTSVGIIDAQSDIGP